MCIKELTVEDGASVTVVVNWFNSESSCPGCIEQFHVGIEGLGPLECKWSKSPWYDENGTETFVTGPLEGPRIYEVHARGDWMYYCTDRDSGTMLAEIFVLGPNGEMPDRTVPTTAPSSMPAQYPTERPTTRPTMTPTMKPTEPVDCEMTEWVGDGCPSCDDGLAFYQEGPCKGAKKMDSMEPASLAECRQLCVDDNKCTHLSYSAVEKKCLTYGKKPCGPEKKLTEQMKEYFFTTYTVDSFAEQAFTREIAVHPVGLGAACPTDVFKVESCEGVAPACVGDFCATFPRQGEGYSMSKGKWDDSDDFKLGKYISETEEVFCHCAMACEMQGFEVWYVSKAKKKAKCECYSGLKTDKKSLKKFKIKSSSKAGFGAFDEEVGALLESLMD